MKKLFNLLIISAFTLNYSCTSNNQKGESESTEAENTTGIKFFKGSFKEAKLKAKAEGKLIFMDAYASWCGPCKMMQKNTFPDPLVGKVFNDKFVSVAYDMEVGEGLALSVEYPVQAYPTLFFMDGDGKIISSELGYRDAAGLINLANGIAKN